MTTGGVYCYNSYNMPNGYLYASWEYTVTIAIYNTCLMNISACTPHGSTVTIFS